VKGGCRPRVYLHIGEPKTGTTFVQQVMWANRASLAARGVLLPGYNHWDHSRASRDLREAPRLAGDPADPWVGEWDVLVRQALRAPRTAVISNELLVACTPGQADRAVRSLLPAEVHIILTARDIASLLPAEWQESVKCRGTVPWEQWLGDVIDTEPATDRRRRSWFWTVHGTLANLEMWSRHIPPDHVHVITVPQQGPADALWTRFTSVVGAGADGADLPRARVNPSLGLVEAEFLRRLNEALPGEMPDWFYTRNIKQILVDDALSTPACQRRLALPPERQAWVREQSENLVARLGESGYHIVGDLAELLSQPATGRYVAPTDLPAQQLLDAAVRATAALADHTYRQTHPPRKQRQPLRGLRQRVSRTGWTVLYGPWTRRVLSKGSHLTAVRQLRVAIWLVLVHPARHRPPAGPTGVPVDRRGRVQDLPQPRTGSGHGHISDEPAQITSTDPPADQGAPRAPAQGA
jgi:hypothetical protein